MQIGLRILRDEVVVFGVDDAGNPLPPDLGVEGYRRLLGIVRLRRETQNHATGMHDSEMLDLIAAVMENRENVLTDGSFVVEISNLGGKDGLHLYDAAGGHVAGPLHDVGEILTAIARQSAQKTP